MNDKPKYPLEQIVTWHRSMWNWLANHPDKEKQDWPGWAGNRGKLKASLFFHYCFACQYALEIRRIKSLHDTNFVKVDWCKYCPLEWPGGYCELTSGQGLFDQWCNDYRSTSKENCETRAKIAAQIRDLPVRPLNDIT